MQEIGEMTIREIALENPASIQVFESVGIDYCCGGKRSLSDACSLAKVEVDRVLDLLSKAGGDAQAPEPADWTQRPLGELIAHIVEKHHSFVRRETPRIASLLAKIVRKHGSAHPELAEVEELFAAMGQELALHIVKEEQILCPYVERMEQAWLNGGALPASCFGTVERPIATMLAEHDDAGALLARIRELSNGYAAPGGACPTYLGTYHGLEEFERDLHHHIHLENNILFPRAIEMEQAR